MRNLMSILVIFALVPVFALDEYLPIKERKIELAVTYSYQSVTGIFDYEGNKQDASGAISTYLLQGKYGLSEGIDAELHWPLIFKDMDLGDFSGLDRPVAALKYAVPGIGVGGFIGGALPFGSKDIVGAEPGMSLKVGIIYGGEFGKFSILSNMSYTLELASADGNKPKDVLAIQLKPGMEIVKDLTAYVFLIGEIKGESEEAELGKGNGGNLKIVTPGVKYGLNSYVSLEAGVPLQLSGENDLASWGLFINLVGDVSILLRN